jgi:hypothetical protein
MEKIQLAALHDGRFFMAEAKELGMAYEVLSPWAEADPIPLKGISPRVPDLAGRRIGLFASNKPAAPRMMDILERKMRERFPSSEISRYNAEDSFLVLQMAGNDRNRFEEWVKSVDVIAAAVGD